MTDGEVQYLERKAAQFRALVNEHQAAGHDAIARKLMEVADELAAKAAERRAERRFRSKRTGDRDEASLPRRAETSG
jgi:hypothetical protein